MDTIKPAMVAQIHRTLCASSKCEYLDKIDYSDPCGSCPNGHWGAYVRIGCPEEHKTVVHPIAVTEWPTILKPLKLLAKPTDRGLGDIVERVIGPVGGDAYKLWYAATFGKPCGCTKRADHLNERFPLGNEILKSSAKMRIS